MGIIDIKAQISAAADEMALYQKKGMTPERVKIFVRNLREIVKKEGK